MYHITVYITLMNHNDRFDLYFENIHHVLVSKMCKYIRTVDPDRYYTVMWKKIAP